MSCMNNIDPFNNIPKSKTLPQPQPQFQQYQYQEPKNPNSRSGTNGQRPNLSSGSSVDLETENFMLRSDLKEAVAYMQKFGLPWPPKK